MNNTKLFLLIGTSLSLIPNLTSAQCVATQDCATLGYTETSCSGGTGVKCPFGNKWACFKSESEICNDLGFTLTCTGSNQTGGAGKACNGKYTECTCAAGYIWNNSSQQCEDATANCTIGALYYSDGTCSQDKLSSKTLLGVVIYEKSASQNGWVMTIKPIQSSSIWGGYGTNISSLPDYTSWSSAAKDFDSCGNTDKIRAQGNSSTYQAAWAAYNYQPSCTPTGKRWCLPAAGVINSLYNNLSTINTAIGKAGGTKLVNDNERIWSSSEYNDSYAWVFCTEDGAGSGGLGKYSKRYDTTSFPSVRPVLAF